MKLIMTLLVRDEADIVQANIEYHLAQGVDFVIVTDHGSTDGTSEILGDFERMGVAKVIRDEGLGHHQSQRVTRMVDMARTEYHADWVINNDADEFWWPVIGSLRDVFAAIPERFAQIEVQRHNFRPLGSECDPFYSWLTLRETQSLGPRGFALGPKVALRPRPDVVVAPGNHAVSGADLAPVPGEGLLEIFHFPTRGYERFEQKVVQTGVGYEQLDDRSPGVGEDQLLLLEMHREGALREYYDRWRLEGEPLQRAIEEGKLVVDSRLEDFMRARAVSGAPHGAENGGGGASEQTARVLTEIARQQEEIATMRDEGQSAAVCIEDLREQILELIARLDRSNRELAQASEALNLIRGSRLMRSSASVRRLYYRARDRS